MLPYISLCLEFLLASWALMHLWISRMSPNYMKLQRLFRAKSQATMRTPWLFVKQGVRLPYMINQISFFCIASLTMGAPMALNERGDATGLSIESAK